MFFSLLDFSYIEISFTVIANTLAELSKKDKTKNLSNKKQKSTGSKQTNLPELSSFQDVAAYLMTALKQVAVAEVVSPEQQRLKFFESKNMAELKVALRSVNVPFASSIKKAQLVELAVSTPALLVPIIDVESQPKEIQAPGQQGVQNAVVALSAASSSDQVAEVTALVNLPAAEETQSEQGPLSSSQSVIQAPVLQGVPNAGVTLSAASSSEQVAEVTAHVNLPAAEKTQSEQGPLSSSQSVIQAPVLQQLPEDYAHVNLPASEETQAAFNAIDSSIQEAEQKRKEAHWEAENAKIKGLQFEVRAGDICDLRIENTMFGGSIGRPRIRENCRILSIGDDLHRRDYIRVWYEYRVLFQGREQNEDEDFFVFKEKGMF